MIFHCKGMPGLGDVMMMMNIVHTKCHAAGVSGTLIFYWDTSEPSRYHYEDPEYMEERIDFLHSLYKKSSSVTIEHVYGVSHDLIDEHRILSDSQYQKGVVEEGEGIFMDNQHSLRTWFFNDDIVDSTPTPKKIVIWRPLFNREEPRKWKMAVNHEQWEKVLDRWNSMGFNVVELTYRTPIREVFYHCRTCEYACFYDGMYHIITSMLHKPSMCVGNTSIAMYNTFNAVPIRTYNEIKNLQKGWNRSQHWERPKINPETGELQDLMRFSSREEMTGREWVEEINDRHRYLVYKAHYDKLDLSDLSLFRIQRHVVKKYGKNRQGSNRGKRRL